MRTWRPRNILLAFALAWVAGCGGLGGSAPREGGASDSPAALLQPPGPPELATAARAEYRPRTVLVKRSGETVSLEPLLRAAGLRLTRERRLERLGIERMRLESGGSVEEACALLRRTPGIEFAEPDYRVRASDTVPTDPRFGELWGLQNVGQEGGLAGADLEMVSAWDLTTGSPAVVVAVLDTGIDAGHPDLAGNLWTNGAEVPANGIDDDGNGFVDDVHGIDAISMTGDLYDGNGHGTHVAGTIAARLDNGAGIVGVAPRCRIMALKFLDSSGSGYSSDALVCLEYALAHGVRISNNSWGGGGFSRALYDGIARAGESGHLFVAAAGNSAVSLDANPSYPAGYDLENIVSVGASNRSEAVAGYSNYGPQSVDLFAPGSAILSCLPNGGYGFLSGTSMAAPHVAGVAALLETQDPGKGSAALKARLMSSVETLGPYEGLCVSNGRLNARWALTGTVPSMVLYSVYPGRAGTGETVELAGKGFGTSRGTVTFGGTQATSIALWSDRLIRLTVPSGAQSGPVVVTTSGGQPTNGVPFVVTFSSVYGYRRAGYDWKEIGLSGQPAFIASAQAQEVDLGFDFTFYDRSYSKVTISAHGYLTFSSDGSVELNRDLPLQAPPFALIAPLWDDLGGGDETTGFRPNIRYQRFGTAPDREFVVSWLGVTPDVAGTGPGTFQAILREGTNDILFQYQDVDFGSATFDGGAAATIGVQNQDGTTAVQYRGPVASGSALQFLQVDVGENPEPDPGPEPGFVRLDSVSPSTVPPGQVLEFFGAGFGATQGAGFVSFPGAPRVTVVESWSDQRIRVRTPASARDGGVSVVTDRTESTRALPIVLDRTVRYSRGMIGLSWRNIASVGTLLPLGDDDDRLVELFPFPFFGDLLSSVRVSSNGYLTFGSEGRVPGNQPLPWPVAPDHLIAPWWDDFNPAAGGQVRVATLGTAPKREFVVSYLNVPHRESGSDGASFQAVLREEGGDILFQFSDTELGNPNVSRAVSGSVGVEDASGFKGLQWPGGVYSNTAMRFQPVAIPRGVSGRDELTPGWSMVSFPVSRLESLVADGGIEPFLLQWDGQGYVRVDARAGAVQAAGAATAYWVLARSPGALEFGGERNDGSTSLKSLTAGWNLIGAPADFPLPFAKMRNYPVGGPDEPLSQSVSSQTPLPDNKPIYRYGFVWENGTYRIADLASAQEALQPGEGMWIYTSRATRLQFWDPGTYPTN